MIKTVLDTRKSNFLDCWISSPFANITKNNSPRKKYEEPVQFIIHVSRKWNEAEILMVLVASDRTYNTRGDQWPY